MRSKTSTLIYLSELTEKQKIRSLVVKTTAASELLSCTEHSFIVPPAMLHITHVIHIVRVRDSVVGGVVVHTVRGEF